MKGIVLAGGTGSRLRPLTYTANKHLIPIANKPILYYVIKSLKTAGIKDIGVVLGYNDPDAVKKFLGDGKKFGVSIQYIFQGEAKGIAHAIYCAKDFVGNSSFVVHLGDNILKNGIKRMVMDFEKNDYDLLISLCEVDNPKQFGIIEFNDDGTIKRIVEKPKATKSNFAIIGVYFFKPFVFDIIRKLKPSNRNELEITDAISNSINSGKRFGIHVIKGWWKDTGKPEDLLEVNRLMLDLIKNRKAVYNGNGKIIGRVEIGSNVKIEGKSIIKGPVSIGNNCVIKDSYIGPYTSIGNNCIIEESEIEDSIIMSDCTITGIHRILDSIIGRNCKIEKKIELPRGRKMIIGENSLIEVN